MPGVEVDRFGGIGGAELLYFWFGTPEAGSGGTLVCKVSGCGVRFFALGFGTFVGMST